MVHTNVILLIIIIIQLTNTHLEKHIFKLQNMVGRVLIALEDHNIIVDNDNDNSMLTIIKEIKIENQIYEKNENETFL